MKSEWKRRIAALLLVAAMLFLAACTAPPDASTPVQQSESTEVTQSADAETSTPAEPEKQLRFAFAIKNLVNPAWIELIEGFEEVCAANGIETDVQATDSETDVDMQLQILQTFLTQDYDVIFVTPLSPVAICSFVKECNEAGTPIVIVDSIGDRAEMEKLGAQEDAYVMSDYKQSGELAAQCMVDHFNGTANIAVLEGTAGSYSANKMLEGIHEVFAQNPGMNVVASQPADYNRNKGYDLATSILTAHPDIQAFLCCNDEMAFGALKAIEDAGLDVSKFAVTGINAVPEAAQAIKDGRLLGSVYKQSALLGQTAAEIGISICLEQPYEKAMLVEMRMITKDNVDELLG